MIAYETLCIEKRKREKETEELDLEIQMAKELLRKLKGRKRA